MPPATSIRGAPEPSNVVCWRTAYTMRPTPVRSVSGVCSDSVQPRASSANSALASEVRATIGVMRGLRGAERGLRCERARITPIESPRNFEYLSTKSEGRGPRASPSTGAPPLFAGAPTRTQKRAPNRRKTDLDRTAARGARLAPAVDLTFDSQTGLLPAVAQDRL